MIIINYIIPNAFVFRCELNSATSLSMAVLFKSSSVIKLYTVNFDEIRASISGPEIRAVNSLLSGAVQKSSRLLRTKYPIFWY